MTVFNPIEEVKKTTCHGGYTSACVAVLWFIYASRFPIIIISYVTPMNAFDEHWSYGSILYFLAFPHTHFSCFLCFISTNAHRKAQLTAPGDSGRFRVHAA